MLEYNRFFIGGEWRRPSVGRTIDVVSPSTERVVGRAPLAGSDDVDAAVAAARSAFDGGPWPWLDVAERREILRKLGQLLHLRAKEIGDLITQENGTLRRLDRGSSAPLFEYFCGLDVPDPERRSSPTGAKALIVREPVGVVAIVVPWNSTGGFALNKILPALMAGCTVVLRTSPETPLDSYPLAETVRASDLPSGVLNIVCADRHESEMLVRHPGVDLVAFTGSTTSGRRVGSICGEQVKRVFLELGGKSAAVVLEDADLSSVIPLLTSASVLSNNGEACGAWTRILVSRSQHDELVALMRDQLQGVRTGDPFDGATDLGPLISARHRERVEGWLGVAVAEGAQVVTGGGRPSGLDCGWYLEPTLLDGATNAMRSSREEIFGPVASVITYTDEDDAIRIANDSDYGLTGAIFTADAEHGMKLARRIRAGTIGVNTKGIDIAFPFGGFKASGLGRQHGPEGLAQFLETKTIAGAV